jgi:hypothetical protein
MSRRLYQRTIPLFIVSLVAGIMIVEYFVVPGTILTTLKEEIQLWGSVIGTLTLAFGYLMLVMRYGRSIYRRETGRPLLNAAATIGSLIFFLAIGLAFEGGNTGPEFLLLYGYIPMYVSTASGMYWPHHTYNPFRLFKWTSPEAIALYLGWILTLLGEMSALVAIWPPFADITYWIQSVPQTGTNRAALAAAAISGIVLGIRALAGREPGLIEMEIGG